MAAVQVFNRSLASSDLYFDLELSVNESSDMTVSDDADSDGMDDAWEREKLGGTGNDGSGDTDGDGYTDLEEYIAGTDPDSDTNFFRVNMSVSNEQIRVGFRAKAAAGTGYSGRTRYYSLERRYDLEVGDLWRGVPGYTNILGADQTVNYLQPQTNVPVFFRGRVWLE